MEFSIRSMKHLLQSQTEKRVSEESSKELGEFLDNWSSEIATEARKIAERKGRKTVRAEDIREAVNGRTHTEVETRTTGLLNRLKN